MSSQPLTFATVCSGIECMSVAARGLPLRPVFFSEIEPFPCAVLRAHYPHVPNLGDMSRISVVHQTEITNGRTTITLPRPLDILAGGTPCQDVSVAGKRAGMSENSGTRSSLSFEFVRLARELRPRFVIWENVAGCIDSKNAPDFLRFANALVECGYNLAYRVLDAQYVRVDGMERALPQRRRRVWLVGCAGADLSLPAKILFDPDCTLRHTPPRRITGQGFAYSLADCHQVHAGMVGGTPGVEPTVARTLERRYDSSFCVDRGMNVVALDGDKLKPRTDPGAGGNGFGINEDGAGYTVTATDRHGVAYATDGGCLNPHDPQTMRVFDERGTFHTLAANSNGGLNRDGVVTHCASFEPGGVKASMVTQNVATTVINGTCPGHHNGLVQCFENHAQPEGRHGGNNLPIVVSCAAPDTARVVSCNCNSSGEDVAPTLDHNTGSTSGIGAQNDKRGGYVIQQRTEGACAYQTQDNNINNERPEICPTMKRSNAKEPIAIVIQTGKKNT